MPNCGTDVVQIAAALREPLPTNDARIQQVAIELYGWEETLLVGSIPPVALRGQAGYNLRGGLSTDSRGSTGPRPTDVTVIH